MTKCPKHHRHLTGQHWLWCSLHFLHPWLWVPFLLASPFTSYWFHLSVILASIPSTTWLCSRLSLSFCLFPQMSSDSLTKLSPFSPPLIFTPPLPHVRPVSCLLKHQCSQQAAEPPADSSHNSRLLIMRTSGARGAEFKRWKQQLKEVYESVLVKRWRQDVGLWCRSQVSVSFWWEAFKISRDDSETDFFMLELLLQHLTESFFCTSWRQKQSHRHLLDYCLPH